MRMGMKSRWISVLVAAGYLLVVSTASLFHHHADQDGGGCCHGQSLGYGASDDHSPCSKPPSIPSSPPSDDNNCSVCQFLAQKPAPTAEVVAVTAGVLVQEAYLPPPAHSSVGVFSAWHSRGPPALA
jgi:hypothetical protein